MANRRRTILLLLLSVALFLVFVCLYDRPGPQDSEPVAAKTNAGVGPKTTSGRPVREDRAAAELRRLPSDPAVPEWINRTAKKRDSSSPWPPNTIFQEGLGLIEAGNYVQARACFQQLINQTARSPLIPYAFLGIAECYRLEGGESLPQAGIQFKDFVVFYPNHELTPYARQRFAELEPFVKAARRRPATKP